MTTIQFKPPWWARNPHIQTILPTLTKVNKPLVSRERLELNDGDFIDLDWCGKPNDGDMILVILHGLEGSSDSHYVRRMLAECHKYQMVAVVHHHRGCSGQPNRLVRSYHSGDTEDFKHTLDTLKMRYPSSPLLACGYSLGGNILAKYLGEEGSNSQVSRSVIVSAPLNLGACAERLEKGFSKIYQYYLIRQLIAKAMNKMRHHELGLQMPVTVDRLKTLKTFYTYDDAVTAPLHGFNGVEDYYQRASGIAYLKFIEIPTLIIHAIDDPFMTECVMPYKEDISQQVHYELQSYGGHVGFINGGVPWRPTYYLEARILFFLIGDE